VLEATKESEVSKQLYLSHGGVGDRETELGHSTTIAGEHGLLGALRNEQMLGSNNGMMARSSPVEWGEPDRKRLRLQKTSPDIFYRPQGRNKGDGLTDRPRIPGTPLQRFYRSSEGRTRSQATRRAVDHPRTISRRSTQALDRGYHARASTSTVDGHSGRAPYDAPQRGAVELAPDHEQYNAAMALVSLGSAPPSVGFADDDEDDDNDVSMGKGWGGHIQPREEHGGHELDSGH
jgi:hypothetical protein